MTLLSLSNPHHPIKFLFFPEFTAKLYPIIVIIFFCALNNLSVDLEITGGIIYAFMFHFFIKKKLKFSNNCIRKIESIGCIQCFKYFGGFVSVNRNKYLLKSDNNKIARNVIVQHDKMKGFVPFKGEVNIAGDSVRSMSGDIPTTTKSQNETLDVKIK